MNLSADVLLYQMYCDTALQSHVRDVTDPNSPRQGKVCECCFKTWVLPDVHYNRVSIVPFDPLWAAAYVLHFFTGLEEAAVLRRYNPNADRFLTGSRWIGAYGSIAFHQLRSASQLLQREPTTRRAVITFMRDNHYAEHDKNIPACPSSAHLLLVNGKLDLHVYQRSLNLTGIGQYDLLLYTHMLDYASRYSGIPRGGFHWTVGSCHVVDPGPVPRGDAKQLEFWLPHDAIQVASTSLQYLPRVLEDM